MSVKQDILNKRFFLCKAVKKIIILTLLTAVIGFGILFTFFNYRSTEEKIKELFGIDMEAYHVASVNDTLKWYRYDGKIELVLELTEEEIAAFIDSIMLSGYAKDPWYHKASPEYWSEDDYFNDNAAWRTIWGLPYYSKGEPLGTVRIREIENGYWIELSYSDG